MKDMAYFVLPPFLIGAVIHYADAWIYVPFTVIAGMIWLGSMIQLGDHRD